MFKLQFVVVAVKAGVQAEKLQLSATAVACGWVENIMIGWPECQLGEFSMRQLPGTQAYAKRIVALIITYTGLWRQFGWCNTVDFTALEQQCVG